MQSNHKPVKMKEIETKLLEMEALEMVNGKSLPLDERKYLSMKDTAGYMGLGFTKVKEIIRGGEFIEYITIGKSNKVIVDRVAFEQFVKDKGHI